MTHFINRYVFFVLILFLFFFACSPRSLQTRKARQLYEKGQTLLSQGKHQEAYEKFERSMYLSKKAEFEPGVAHNLNEMAIIDTSNGDYAEARKKLEKAVEIYKMLNMAPEVSKAMNNIVLTYLKAHEFSAVIKYYGVLLEWDEETGNRLGMGITLYNLGLIYDDQLKMKNKARIKYQEALSIFRDIGADKYIDVVERKAGLR